MFCSTPGVALSRNISPKVAAKMLFTGEPLNALEALQCGLISELVQIDNESKIDQLEKRVIEIAKQIASNSRYIVALGKQALYEQLDEARLENAYKIASKAMLENLKFEDTQLGLQYFAAKKKPEWNHSNKKVQ